MIPKDVEERLQYIEFFTRKKIRNLMVGSYRSVLKGHGYDFVDHKSYTPGDDIRKIDWNALARTRVPLIKNTHEERDLDVFVVADFSSSMALASGKYSKKELLLYISAALAYSALSDHIKIGFLGFTDSIEIEIEPKKGKAHLWTILNKIWDKEMKAKTTRVTPVLERLRQVVSRLSIVFFISDFFFEEDMFEQVTFKSLVSRHDFIPILLNDPMEAHLPKGHGYMRLRDLETNQERVIRLTTHNRILYEQMLRDKHRELIEGFYQYNLNFVEVQTDQPFYELIASLFLMRKRK